MPRAANNTWTREAEHDMILALVGYLTVEDVKKVKNMNTWDKVTEVMHEWGYAMTKDALVARWNKKILRGFKDRRVNGIEQEDAQPVTPRHPISKRANTKRGQGKKRSRAEAEEEAENHDGEVVQVLDSDEEPMAAKRARSNAVLPSTTIPVDNGATAAPKSPFTPAPMSPRSLALSRGRTPLPDSRPTPLPNSRRTSAPGSGRTTLPNSPRTPIIERSNSAVETTNPVEDSVTDTQTSASPVAAQILAPLAPAHLVEANEPVVKKEDAPQVAYAQLDEDEI